MKYAVLTFCRYPAKHRITAFQSMALFRPPLALNRAMDFFKLLGCSKTGTFNMKPDWQQYGIFSVSDDDKIPPLNPLHYETWKKEYYGNIITGWWKFCGAETFTLVLEPYHSHGKWSGRELFPNVTSKDVEGPIGILTRASIRFSKAKEFWNNVAPVQAQMSQAKGLLYSVGIGEMPYLRQATFSIWENSEAMKNFAYTMKAHRDVISKTRERNWYSEEMFTRFLIQAKAGKLKGEEFI
jgi:hypothetical protein